MIKDEKKFMEMAGQSVSVFNQDQFDLYISLVEEEYSELITAIDEEPMENVIKEIVDNIVVQINLLISTGIGSDGAQKAWDLVWKNNMSKVSNSDSITYDESGKIMKSPESIARKAEMMDGIRTLIGKG